MISKNIKPFYCNNCDKITKNIRVNNFKIECEECNYNKTSDYNFQIQMEEYKKTSTDKDLNSKINIYNQRYDLEFKDKIKFISSLYARLRNFLKGKDNSIFTRKIIGCSPKELKKHLENNWAVGMNWNNYGFYGWHIDHIIPVSSANNKKELYVLFHHTNLQPLWARENLKKSNKIYQK